MIEPTSASIPVGTWAKHNSTEVVRYDRKHGEEHSLQTVFRTVYYEYDHGTVSVRNVSSSSQVVNLLV